MLSLLLACSTHHSPAPESTASTAETPAEVAITDPKATEEPALTDPKQEELRCAERCALNKKAEAASELRSASMRDKLLIAHHIEQQCKQDCESSSKSIQPSETDKASMTIKGLSTPESVLYDAKLDRYLISNINGDPTAKDGNGFISLLTADGKLSTLISSTEQAKLHAPKGMGIQGNKLYIADIDVVHVYDARHSDFLYDVPIEGAEFLNDVVATETDVYVSDSATGQIHSIHPEGKSQPEFADSLLPKLGKINGLARKGRHLLVTSDQQLVRYHLSKKQLQIINIGASQLDGIALGIDDSAYVSSWETGTIYKVSNLDKEPTVEVVLEDLNTPADIGFDPKRNRLLVPLFKQDEVLLHPLSR